MELRVAGLLCCPARDRQAGCRTDVVRGMSSQMCPSPSLAPPVLVTSHKTHRLQSSMKNAGMLSLSRPEDSCRRERGGICKERAPDMFVFGAGNSIASHTVCWFSVFFTRPLVYLKV